MGLNSILTSGFSKNIFLISGSEEKGTMFTEHPVSNILIETGRIDKCIWVTDTDGNVHFTQFNIKGRKQDMFKKVNKGLYVCIKDD